MKDKQNKIIVGMDFSPFSLNALETAAYFAKNHDHEIVLVYVVEASRSIIDYLEGNDPEEKIKDAVRKKLIALEESYTAKGVKISHIFKSGKAFSGILEAAEEIDAELIFMGSRGIETLGEAFLGSNASRVARNAGIPVITVKEKHHPVNLETILVPVEKDFGVREIRAFLKGYRKDFGSHVELLAITDEGTDGDELKKLEVHMAKQKVAFTALGFTDVNTTIIHHNTPAEAILAFADDASNKIDMILMETHGRSGISNFIMGSTTEEVISYSKKPVFSLRPERQDSVRYYYHSNLPI